MCVWVKPKKGERVWLREGKNGFFILFFKITEGIGVILFGIHNCRGIKLLFGACVK